MARSLSVAFLCVLLVGTAALSGVLAVPTDRSDEVATAQSDRSSVFSQPERFASTTFSVEVYGNGSARWTFSYFTDSLNTSEQEEFGEYAQRFERRDTDLWTEFQASAAALVSAGTNVTERNMSARNFRRAASLNDVGNRGVVTMSFLWTGFGERRDDQVLVGDVFEGVFYIGPNQWLVFESGPDLQFVPERITPEPDAVSGPTLAQSDSLTYYGEQQFPDNTPRIVLSQNTGDGGATDGSGGTDEGTTDGSGAAGTFPMLLFGLVVVVVGLGAVAVWRFDGFGTADEGAVTAAPDDDSTAGTAATATTTDPSADTDPAVSEEELLTDEDRVVQLLEDNGGRMKQANIVEETDWSKSKVSMLLSDMEEDDAISKLRVGRENIVSLRGHEPDAAGSPFDDED